MHHPSPSSLFLHLGWEFTSVLTKSLSRNTNEVRAASRDFYIIGPEPSGRHQPPLTNPHAKPPYLYVVFGSDGGIRYVGKGTDRTLKSVLQRWIRPDKITGIHCWSHGTRNKEAVPTIMHIAEEINAGKRPIRLFFSSYSELFPFVLAKANQLRFNTAAILALSPAEFIKDLERELIFTLQPPWNILGRRQRPHTPLNKAAYYWNES